MIKDCQKLTRLGDAFIKKHGTNQFHRFASDALSKAELHKKFRFEDFALGVLSSKVHQNYPHLEFSDFPQTISYGENCFIDVYFWRRRPTMIHNHHFNGAFTCLEGRNVDLEFKFKRLRKLSAFHDLGSLILCHQRTILPGTVVPIDLLDKFIHQNHHQADLTVNLCFRTPELSKKNISSYLFSGLRTEKNSGMLARVYKLRRLLDLGPVDPKKIDLSSDDALYFLSQYLGSDTQNKGLNRLLNALHSRVKNDLGIDMKKLLNDHDATFEKFENDYE